MKQWLIAILVALGIVGLMIALSPEKRDEIHWFWRIPGYSVVSHTFRIPVHRKLQLLKTTGKKSSESFSFFSGLVKYFTRLIKRIISGK